MYVTDIIKNNIIDNRQISNRGICLFYLASLVSMPFLILKVRRIMKSLDFEAQSTLSYALSNGILDLDRVHEFYYLWI